MLNLQQLGQGQPAQPLCLEVSTTIGIRHRVVGDRSTRIRMSGVVGGIGATVGAGDGDTDLSR